MENTAEEIELVKKSALFFVGLDKLVRGIKLYEGKGSLVEQLLKDVYSKATDLFVQEQTYKITPVGPMIHSEVLSEEGKNPSYLFQLYCDGVRELSFTAKLSQDEIFALALTFYGGDASEEEDLVTALWRREFKGIRYYAVDTLGIQVDESGEVDMLTARSEQLASEEEGEEMTLSSSDLRLLRSEDALSWVQKCNSPFEATGNIKRLAEQMQHDDAQSLKRFVAISLEIFEKREEEQVLLQQLWTAFLRKEDASNANAILETLCELQKVPLALRTIGDFFAEDLDLLPPLLEKDKKLLSTVRSLLDIPSFDKERLVSLMKNMSIGNARDSLLDALSKAGTDMTEFYLDNLTSENEEIVIDAIQSLGKIGSDAALSALGSALGHSTGKIRAEALNAMGGRFLLDVQRPLSRLLKDPDPELRIGALNVLKQCQERSFGSALLGVIKEPDFIKRPVEEQEEFFMSLSRFPNASTMTLFTDILAEKNITRSAVVQKRQVFVVKALGEIGTDNAISILKKQGKSWLLASAVKEEIRNVLAKK